MSDYVLLNDTCDTWHHGCRAVSGVIRREMMSRGWSLSVSCRVGENWWELDQKVEQIKKSPLVVINGEGTLHDGALEAAKVMKIFEFRNPNQPTVLINSIWRNNPSEWGEQLRNAAYVSVRDRMSQSILKSVHGIEADFCLDLSLCSMEPKFSDLDRTGLVWGDALNRKLTRRLYKSFSESSGENYYASIRPAKRSCSENRVFKDFRSRFVAWLRGQSVFHDERDYVDFLSQRSLYVTGRFHGVCLSIVAGTPFLALPSNTDKIACLIDDMGLNKKRQFSSLEQILTVDPDDWVWTEEERIKIYEELIATKRHCQMMFDHVCRL